MRVCRAEDAPAPAEAVAFVIDNAAILSVHLCASARAESTLRCAAIATNRNMHAQQANFGRRYSTVLVGVYRFLQVPRRKVRKGSFAHLLACLKTRAAYKRVAWLEMLATLQSVCELLGDPASDISAVLTRREVVSKDFCEAWAVTPRLVQVRAVGKAQVCMQTPPDDDTTSFSGPSARRRSFLFLHYPGIDTYVLSSLAFGCGRRLTRPTALTTSYGRTGWRISCRGGCGSAPFCRR